MQNAIFWNGGALTQIRSSSEALSRKVYAVPHQHNTLLMLSATGGRYMGPEATTVYKQLAEKVSQKQQNTGWLSFTTLRASIMCTCGTDPCSVIPLVGDC